MSIYSCIMILNFNYQKKTVPSTTYEKSLVGIWNSPPIVTLGKKNTKSRVLFENQQV